MDYMLRIMRDKTVDHDRRDKMAAAAAPYVHAKLQSTMLKGADGGDLKIFIQRFADDQAS